MKTKRAPAKAVSRTNAASKAKAKVKVKAKSGQAKHKTATPTARRAPKKLVAKVSRNPTLTTALAALEDMKAVDVRVLDVRGISDVTDYMVVASGTSDRHLRSIADRVVQMAKASGKRPLGLEGEQQGEWVLVDLPDVMVHLMLPRTREFYQLEQLWESAPKARGGRGG